MKKAAIFLKIWIIFLYPAALIQGQSGKDVVYQVGNPGNDDTCVLNDILIDKDHRIITTGSFAGAAYVKNSSDRFLSSTSLPLGTITSQIGANAFLSPIDSVIAVPGRTALGVGT